jgi:hypothetical protein
MAAEAAVETKAMTAQAMSNDPIFTTFPKSSNGSHLLQASKGRANPRLLNPSADASLGSVSLISPSP